MANEKNSLNEILKAREAVSQEKSRDGVVALDDTQRVKVLSPGRLVSKRFFRNKLALVGLTILILMFLFSFLCPLFYPYGQTDTFFKYDYLSVDYAVATQRESYSNYTLSGNAGVHYSVSSSISSYVSQMEDKGFDVMPVTAGDGSAYLLLKQGDGVYALETYSAKPVATWSAERTVGIYNSVTGEMDTDEELTKGFISTVASAVKKGSDSFSYGGVDYSVSPGDIKILSVVSCKGGDSLTYLGSEVAGLDDAFFEAQENGASAFTHRGVLYSVTADGNESVISAALDAVPVMVSSLYVFDAMSAGTSFSDEFRFNALLALYGGGDFTADGREYYIQESEGTNYVYSSDGAELAMLSTVAVRRYTGEDNLSLDFKRATAEKIAAMQEAGEIESTFVFPLPELDERSEYVRDAEGNFVYVDTELTATRKLDRYILTCEQVTHLIDIYAPPSAEHIFGTDSDGMDILARMMYGGRISLMVGFVVVILETLIGIIMGGLAGFFSGWVDTLIMRLVDIFYCIPTYPILIIMGAFFDSIKLGSYMRLVWMMAIMGILGWASIARLVRGQILSLREQEFMTAAEATGLRAGRRIFKHLIPNVMPQLIVSATMGLGNVIIMESTLSFLGLGVKHPLATWGTMINSITSSNENLVRYAYIWIPVGLLICLTVIAFNFVGDGLRDAFDPKMKR